MSDRGVRDRGGRLAVDIPTFTRGALAGPAGAPAAPAPHALVPRGPDLLRRRRAPRATTEEWLAERGQAERWSARRSAARAPADRSALEFAP